MKKTYEEQLREALSRQDAVMYARACLGLGRKGEEDPELYQTGLEFLALQKQETEKLFKRDKGLEAVPQSNPTSNQSQAKIFNSEGERYLAFLQEVRKKDVNIADWGLHCSTKTKLLKEYFPHKFEKGAKQDLDAKEYSPKQIGYIFLHIFNQAKTYNGK